MPLTRKNGWQLYTQEKLSNTVNEEKRIGLLEDPYIDELVG
jgi:hypothetical protein